MSSKDMLVNKLMKLGAVQIQIPLDIATGAVAVMFTYKGQKYHFKYKDINASQALKKLSYSIRMLCIAHERGILLLDKTAKEYIAIGAPEGYVPEQTTSANASDFIILGCNELSSNEEIKKAYMRLIRTYHPDRTMLEEDKKFNETKTAQVNAAFNTIKKARGFE